MYCHLFLNNFRAVSPFFITLLVASSDALSNCSAACRAHINELHLHYSEAVAGTVRRVGDRACPCATV